MKFHENQLIPFQGMRKRNKKARLEQKAGCGLCYFLYSDLFSRA